MLDTVENTIVTGETGQAGDTLRLVCNLHPDIIIVDLGLQEVNEVCRQVKDLPEPPHVLVYTARDRYGDLLVAHAAGADSYLHKVAECQQLRETVERISEGENIWLPSPGSARYNVCHQLTALTSKETEILSLIMDGYSNKRIIESLQVSSNTVKTHIRKLLRDPANRLWPTARTPFPTVAGPALTYESAHGDNHC